MGFTFVLHFGDQPLFGFQVLRFWLVFFCGDFGFGDGRKWHGGAPMSLQEWVPENPKLSVFELHFLHRTHGTSPKQHGGTIHSHFHIRFPYFL